MIFDLKSEEFRKIDNGRMYWVFLPFIYLFCISGLPLIVNQMLPLYL